MLKNIFKRTTKIAMTILTTLGWLWAVGMSLTLSSQPSDLLVAAGVLLICFVTGAMVWLMGLIWKKKEEKTNEKVS